MTLRFGCVYRHKLTGARFRIDEIWVRENVIEGGVALAIRCVVDDADETTYVFGEPAVVRMWPHLELVGHADQGKLSEAWTNVMRNAGAEVFDPSVTHQGADGELPD